MTINNDEPLEELAISTANSRTAQRWEQKTYSWEDLLKRLSTPTVTAETHHDFISWSKTKRDEIKDVGGFVGGSLKGGRRKKDNVESRSLITLDVDHANHNLWDDIKLTFPDTPVAVYSTHSYSTSNPRIRIIIPLIHAITAEQYEPVARKIAERLGMDNFDDTTYEAERLMYWPSHSRGGEYFFKHEEGEILDPDEILAEYKDWHDTFSWPVSSRTSEVHKKDATRQGDPLTKTGYIGAFNRTYDIRAVIDKYLSDVYAPTENEDRYTYIPGSTTGGLVLYDDKFAYSHHSTDPVGDTLRSAFDLVRIHKFGDLDETTKPDTPATKQPSYNAMVELIKKDPAVMAQLQADQIGTAKEDFEDETGEVQPSTWFSSTRTGAPIVNTNQLAIQIRDEHPVFYNGDAFLWYDTTTGLWRDGAEPYLKALIQTHYLIDLADSKRVRETVEAIKNQQYEAQPFPDPDPNNIVLKNGVYNIPSNRFALSFDKSIHARVAHSVKYDPKATAETFKGYVEAVVGKENAPFIYEWFGYCFYQGYPIQKMLFLYGPGSSGKSTLINLLRSVVGKESYASVPLEDIMQNDFAVAGLYHKTVNFDADAKPEYLKDGSKLKVLTGEDTAHADVKYKTPIEFYNYAKLTFATNQLPAMRDAERSLERRMIIVKTPQPISDETIKKYPISEMEKELSGIFNLAMDSLRHVLKKKCFTNTNSMKDELAAWLSENDPVARFLDEATTHVAGKYETVDDVYNSYTEYALNAGENKLSRIKFYQHMKQKGYDKIRQRVSETNRPYAFQDIQINDEYRLA